MTPTRDGERDDALFQALAHPVRRRVLELLLEQGPSPVGRLHEQVETSLPTLSHHLAVLRDVGLVAHRREGRHLVHWLTPGPLLELLDWMHAFADTVRGQLDRLGVYLEVESVEDPAPAPAPATTDGEVTP